MQNFIINQIPNIIIPLGKYVSIPSLLYTKDLSDVLLNVSFSYSPIKNNRQLINLHYSEWDSLFTLWWYNISFDINNYTTISHFATANLRKLSFVHNMDSEFAAKLHLLRTPISWIWTKLFKHLIHTAKIHKMPFIKISSDVSSVDFYKKMSQKFSEHFINIHENYVRCNDWWCDFVFLLR